MLVGFIALGVLLCAAVKIRGKNPNGTIFRVGVVLVLSPKRQDRDRSFCKLSLTRQPKTLYKETPSGSGIGGTKIPRLRAPALLEAGNGRHGEPRRTQRTSGIVNNRVSYVANLTIDLAVNLQQRLHDICVVCAPQRAQQ